MSDVVVFPDATAVVLDHLHTELGVDVGSKIPNEFPDDGVFVLCRRLGGPRLNEVADNAMLGLEFYAATAEDSMDLAQLTRAQVHAMRGRVISGVTVYRVTEIGGPAELPDPLSQRPRVVFTVQVAMRGVTTGS